MKTKAGKVKNKKIADTILSEVGRVGLSMILVLAIVVIVLIWHQIVTSRQTSLTLESEAASFELQDFLESYIQTSKQLSVDPNVKALLRETLPGDDITAKDGFQGIFENMVNIQQLDAENIQAVWVADLDANVLTQSDGFTSGEGWDITGRAWYKCFEEGGLVMTEPYVDSSTGKTILSAVMPVYDEDGTALGAAGLDVSLEHLNEILAGYRIGSTGYVVLFTSEGTVVYHPDAEKLQQNIAEAGFSKSFVDAAGKGVETFLKYQIDKRGIYGYISSIDGTGYMVASAMRASEYYRTLFITVVILILIFAGSILIAFRRMKGMAAKLSEPIVRLNDTALQLASGNLDVEIHVDREDEIGELGRSIGKTVDRLKEYIAYIDELSYALGEIASGNLNVELKQDYVGEFAILKEGIDNITGSMTEVLSNIRESASQVAMGADDLAGAAQSLAESVTTQAAAVEELTATSVTVAEQVEASGKEAEISAKETAKVNQMMNESQDRMKQMDEAMGKIDETSRQVVSIIQTIEEIADQTNLLALNAAIEAARAGEAGKGFTVVASEIGKLADESAKAANTTRELIGVSISEIGKGGEITAHVMESLQEVVNAVENVNQMIRSTAENAVIQAESMDQIRIGVGDISDGIQSNSAMAEESSATSTELARQAGGLNDLVQKFALKE